MSVQGVPEWGELNRTEHAPIIDAIAAGDGADAGYLMWAHLQSISEALLDALDELGLWGESGSTTSFLPHEFDGFRFSPTWSAAADRSSQRHRRVRRQT